MQARQTDTQTGRQLMKDKTAKCSIEPISGLFFLTFIKRLSWDESSNVCGLSPWNHMQKTPPLYQGHFGNLESKILTPRSPRILPPPPPPQPPQINCTPPPDTKRTFLKRGHRLFPGVLNRSRWAGKIDLNLMVSDLSWWKSLLCLCSLQITFTCQLKKKKNHCVKTWHYPF